MWLLITLTDGGWQCWIRSEWICTRRWTRTGRYSRGIRVIRVIRVIKRAGTAADKYPRGSHRIKNINNWASRSLLFHLKNKFVKTNITATRHARTERPNLEQAAPLKIHTKTFCSRWFVTDFAQRVMSTKNLHKHPAVSIESKTKANENAPHLSPY